MASLTKTAEVSRKAIKYGSVAFVAITVLWFLGGAAINYYKALNPPAPMPPAEEFGMLAPIIFPKESARPQLALELPTGVIPKFADRASVYSAPTKRSGFLDADRAIETARALNFVFKPTIPSPTRYIWSNQDQLASKLDMDITSGHFLLTRIWQNSPALLTLSNFVSDQQVTNDTLNYLRKTGLMPEDINNQQKIIYLKGEGGKLVPTISLSEADFVQIDFFRNNLDVLDPTTKIVTESYPFYRPSPDYGLIRAILSASRDINQQIVSLDYQYTRVDYPSMGVYPIKTGDQAWTELSSGGGYVTSKGPKTGTVKIRRVILGYYDSDQPQMYEMPIYVFLGDQGFTAYVSAIVDSAMKSK